MSPSEIIFDSHCHLVDRAYPDPAAVIRRAQEGGVRYLLAVGLERQNCAATVQLAEQHKDVYAGVGIHPHEADRFQDDDIRFLRELAANPKVRGIGETGLDFFREYADHENQRRAFHAHIELARELNRPLILHIRNAYPEALGVLREHGYYHGVMHCYSGDRAFALAAVELGFYVSFSGSLTYGGSRLPEVARSLPQERILVETDAPYLTPMPYRGKQRNEPALVRHTLLILARALNLPLADAARLTTENACRLFEIEAP